jgi:HK97 family phage major capsid protein
MADRYKQLQDEAAQIAARIDAVQAMECGDDGDKIAARDLELEGLVTRGAEVEKKLDFERRVVEAAKTARAAVNRCVPADPGDGEPEGRAAKQVRIEPVPFRGELRAYKGPQAVDHAHAVGMWFKAQFAGSVQARQWCHDHGIEVRNTHVEGVNSLGGFLVPSVMLPGIIRYVDVYTTWARNMQGVTMESDHVFKNKRLSGLTMSWVGENVEGTPSTMALGLVEMVAQKLSGIAKVSNELLEDSASAVNLGDEITEEFGIALAAKLEAAAIDGDGTSAYGGIQGLTSKIAAATASIHTTGSGRDTWEELTAADFLGAVGKLPQFARAGAKWYISPLGHSLSMARLELAAGGKQTLADGITPAFAGYPVEFTDELPNTDSDLTNQYIAYFGRADLAGMFGLRRQFAITPDSSRYREYDVTGFFGFARGTMIWHSLGDTSTAGPLIAIKGNT